MIDSQEFLQSEEWLRFQQATGKETFSFSKDGLVANGIRHILPWVGSYLYIPRGPRGKREKGLGQLVDQATEEKMKWIRIEPETESALAAIREQVLHRIVKAPHDMQPKSVFKIDVTLSEEELLAQMKPKTRYNIRLAEKHGVKIFETREEKYIKTFLDLITKTSDRKGITPHPRNYYETFFTTLPEAVCKLFVAEYEGEVLAANLVIFFGDTVTYLHGGSNDQHREVMAPYLLQWEQIKTAKNIGYQFYDFGGVKTEDTHTSWQGITKFKTGFAPKVAPTVFPGTYDIILAPLSYTVYRLLQKAKHLVS